MRGFATQRAGAGRAGAGRTRSEGRPERRTGAREESGRLGAYGEGSPRSALCEVQKAPGDRAGQLAPRRSSAGSLLPLTFPLAGEKQC